MESTGHKLYAADREAVDQSLAEAQTTVGDHVFEVEVRVGCKLGLVDIRQVALISGTTNDAVEALIDRTGLFKIPGLATVVNGIPPAHISRPDRFVESFVQVGSEESTEARDRRSGRGDSNSQPPS